MVGFSYLLTLDVSLSLWFFFLFYKFQCFIGATLGFQLSRGAGVQWTGRSFSAAQEAGGMSDIRCLRALESQGAHQEYVRPRLCATARDS